MRSWDAARVATASGATLLTSASAGAVGPDGASIDSRRLAHNALFIGLPGEHVDGGAHGLEALQAGAWGALLGPEHARAAAEAAAGGGAQAGHGGAVLEHPEPLAAMQALASAWRRELQERGARVVAITGSTGKTSTKDILAALLSGLARTAASPQNNNTEIGLPLAILAAGEDVEVLVLEMAMRGPGQIAELTDLAGPDVGVIVNVGPAHLELLGSIEAIAAAKAELIACMEPGRTIVIPHEEPLLAGHVRGDLSVLSFGGPGADVKLAGSEADGGVVVCDRGERIHLWPSFSQAHNLRNLLAAVAAARALSYTPEGPLRVSFSEMRGQRSPLAVGGLLIDDCYNANPMSMRAALEDLAATAPGRRVAVLGEMLELGAEAPRLHREIGRFARAQGVEVLVAVGPLASEMASAFGEGAQAVTDAQAAIALLDGMLVEGDTVLIKASRGVGLESVSAALTGEARPAASGRR
jgi:UDP-N-acetylmuramoyl-tripeptide--D-alanyl-D-alanine ligase